MTDATWFYRDSAGECGPASLGELAELVRNGRIHRETGLRAWDADEWSTAGELAPTLFAAPASPVGTQGAQLGWSDFKPHPWRRYAARLTDNVIVGGFLWFLSGIIFFLVAPEQAENFFAFVESPGGRIIDIMLTLLFALPGNALIIGLTGSSIGKWVFGVRVLKNNVPMGFLRALRRELRIWVFGLAFGIPLLSLVTMGMSYGQLRANLKTSWDKAESTTVVHRDESFIATVLMWMAVVVLVVMIMAIQATAA